MPEEFRLIAVLTPEDSKKAIETGVRTMIVGWAVGSEGVVRPAGRFLCDVVHVDVGSSGIAGFAELMVGECRAVGARGIFINPKGRVPDADDLEAFLRAFKSRGIRVYMPEKLCSPGVIAVRETLGGERDALEPGMAIFLRAMCKKTVVPKMGTAASKNIPFSELSELIGHFSPRVYSSSELGAKYFSCKAGSDTIFCVFDDRESFRRKIERAREKGVSDCFVLWSELKALENI